MKKFPTKHKFPSAQDEELLQVATTCAWSLAKFIYLMDDGGILLSEADAKELG